jgi:ArsR family transcriptional regulator
MNETRRILGLLAEPARLRILLLLGRRELCGCQIMGVLGMSQPLVSRNLALLSRAGLLDARRDGKMMYYRLSETLPDPAASLVRVLRNALAGDGDASTGPRIAWRLHGVPEKDRKCGMETFLKYMEQKKRRRKA